MTYCIKCGKPTNNGIMCEDCIILDSPWLLAMKSKEADLVEQIEKFKAENAELRHRAQVAENELKLYKLAVKIWQERYSDIRCFNFNIALRQAEKELAKEGKDE